MWQSIEKINMKEKDRKYVVAKINDEGFDYTFIGYSDFKDINDEEFHKLRQAYIDAVNAMKSYLKYEEE